MDAGGSFPPLNPPGVVAAPPPLAAPVDDTARRLAEEERLKWERLKSPMMVMDGGGGNVGVGPQSADRPNGSQVAYEETDANRRFLNAAFDFCLGCEVYLLMHRAAPRRRPVDYRPAA